MAMLTQDELDALPVGASLYRRGILFSTRNKAIDVIKYEGHRFDAVYFLTREECDEWVKYQLLLEKLKE